MASSFLLYLPVLIAAAVFLILGAVCFYGSQRAMERSRKSLSWIKRHGAGGYPFARNAFPQKPADWLGVFGVCVFALVVSMVSYALRAHAQGVNWLSGLFSAQSLIAIAFCVGGAAALYFLLQRLFGSTLVSASGSLLFAASFVGAHAAASVLAIALLLMVLWLMAEQRSLFPTELLYYAACLTLAGAIALRSQLLPFALLFIGLHIYKHIALLRRDGQALSDLVLALALSVFVWVLGMLVFVFARVLFYYGLNMRFIGERLLPDFIGGAFRLLRGGLRSAVRPLLRSRVLLPLMDAPLLGIGGFGAISALLLYTRRKDPRSILVLLLLAVAALVWLLSDCSVLNLALTLTAALLFSNFERGGLRWPVITACAVGVVYYLALLILAYYLPLADGIVSRIG